MARSQQPKGRPTPKRRRPPKQIDRERKPDFGYDDLPVHIQDAIESGGCPVMRDWRWLKEFRGNKVVEEELKRQPFSTAETIMIFAERFLKIPEGEYVGNPLVVTLFQEVFICCVFQDGVDTATLSIARRNGKTFVIAIICLALLASKLSVKNRVIGSAAMSRDQAAILYRAMSQMIDMSPQLNKILHCTESAKRIQNLNNGSEYYAMSSDAKTGHGKSLAILILDESGQIVNSTNEFVEMLITSQGSYDNPLFITISTQAPADKSWLSQQIDSAILAQPENVVTHVYKADEGCELDDEYQWIKANPLIPDGFRSKKDMVKLSKKAMRLPAAENGFRNLNLNQRISLESVWIAPKIWKENSGDVAFDVFERFGVSVGLDLSQKHDLTAAVLSAKDESGFVHVHPYCFIPLDGIEEKEREDKNPYQEWIRTGFLIGVPGKTISYDWVCEYLKEKTENAGIDVNTIEFDRWRIEELKGAAERTGFAQISVWNEVGQGYKDMSPRLEAMETGLLEGRIRHGNHPLLLLAAANAIAVSDPTASKKLDKTRCANKIDPIVAMVQSVYPLMSGLEEMYSGDLSYLVG